MTRHVIGHRGLAAAMPENTLEGIEFAAQLGLRWVEFDVRLTRDGHLILMHDATLNRTTNGRGRVIETPFDEMRKLDAGAWFYDQPQAKSIRIPTMHEALCLAREHGICANVELKPDRGREAELGTAVGTALRLDWSTSSPSIVVSSFSAACLRAFRETNDQVALALLVRAVPRNWRKRLSDLGAVALHVEDTKLTEAQAAAVKAANYDLRVFTVNEPARARLLFGWGVDGVVTDRAEVYRAVTWAP